MPVILAFGFFKWCWRLDSNQRPPPYHGGALPIVLRQHPFYYNIYMFLYKIIYLFSLGDFLLNTFDSKVVIFLSLLCFSIIALVTNISIILVNGIPSFSNR